MKEKIPLSHEVVCFQVLDLETSNSKSEVSKSSSWKITSSLKTTLLQRELFLTLPITRNQEILYDNNYFEKLPIVSTAFKVAARALI